jgi:alkylation response protein AidB-like acyl-CoA dehydrogenase
MQMPEFFQDAPQLGNQWRDDRALRSLASVLLPADVLAELEPGLDRLGARAGGEMLGLADAAEANPPRHVPYDAWGLRVDRIEVSDAWRALDRIAAEEAVVATAYERGPFARVHQAMRLYLYHPSSAVYSCPLAMTDGAARCLMRHGAGDPELARVVAHLTSRDPDRFWTSGQWMTERTGGSDVSRTSTVARPAAEGTFALHGTKWFTSATTSQVALTLARIDDGTPSAGGGAALSLFLVELRDAEGALRGIRVNRLKDKLGTHALPTAELTLEGAPARLVGGAGNGVRKIADVLNVTRYYNAVCAAAQMRRCVALATDYATRRVAFGRTLAEHPLHVETLAEMQVEAEGALHLVMHVATLMGQVEAGDAGDETRHLLRVLTPVAKLYTARQAVAVASETLEAFGGAGYVEDTGLPRLLRDAQVLAIWEGTTNVLALDVLRAAASDDSMTAVLSSIWRGLDEVAWIELAPAVRRVRVELERLARHVGARGAVDGPGTQADARSAAFAIARLCIAMLLLRHADLAVRSSESLGARALTVATRWCARELVPGLGRDAAHRAASATLLWEPVPMARPDA